MFVRKVLAVLIILVFVTGTVSAQMPVHRIAIVPLTVDEGVPLKIVLTERLRSKLNEPVHGKIVDPVYVFDREVIPAGTEVLGKVTGYRSVGKLKRISSMLGADFTPLHDAEITFDTLVFADGKQLPLKTSAVSTTNLLVRFKNGQTRTFTTNVTKPTLSETLHTMLWSLSPYHPQFVATGTMYKATLLESLDFGSAFYGTSVLNGIGTQPPAGSVAYARLLTAVDSKTTKTGTAVQAILTYPLYSLDHRLLFPEGSRLQGEVTEAHSSGLLEHGGKLEIKFTKIQPPMTVMSSMSQIREIHGRLVGIEPPADLNQLRIDNDGQAQVQRTNGRFLAPAFALAGAAPMLGTSSSSVGTAVAESYGTSFFSRALGGGSGLGIPAGVAGLMVPPVGMALGAYAVGYAVYSNILGHGKNITLPADTSIELRFD